MKKEKFLRVDPSGKYEFVELSRKLDEQTNYEYLDFESVCEALQCELVEVVHTQVHQSIVMLIDDSGACDPVRPVNFKCSHFYGGYENGIMIHGPVIFAQTRPRPDFGGEIDFFPVDPSIHRLIIYCLNHL